MKILWSQLITNVLGFLLLFWGLKKFAWGPLLGFLDARRARIRTEFDNVDAGRRENDSLRADLERQLREVDATARQKIEEATAEGKKLAADIQEEARAKARKDLEKAKTDIDHERNKARIELRNDIVDMAVLGAEKIIKDRVQGDGQKQLVERFIEELEQSNA